MEMGIVDNSTFSNESVLRINALSMAIEYHVNRAAAPGDVVDTADAFYKFLNKEGERGF